MCYVYNQWYDISCATLYLYKILKEFGIPNKLVNLIKVTLQNWNGKVNNQGQVTEASGIGKRLESSWCTVYSSTVQYCTGESDK